MTAGLLVALLPLFILVLLLPSPTGTPWPPTGRWLVVALAVVLAAAYAMVRRGWLTAGILVAIFAIEGAVFASRWDAASHGQGQQALTFLVLPVLLAGVLLRPRAAFSVAGATLVLAWFIEGAIDHRLGSALDTEDLGLGVLLAAVGVISVVSAFMSSQQARNLDENVQLLRQLAENIPEVFFVVSPDLRRAYYSSPAYETLWGRPISGYLANPLDWLNGIHPDDLPRVRESLQANPGGPLDFRVLHPSGRVRYMSSRTFPVHDSRGNVIRLVGISEMSRRFEKAKGN
ncbi:MAG: PAS domain-containing protein [Thermoplasmatota archaeon]